MISERQKHRATKMLKLNLSRTKKKAFAKTMRKNPTEAEFALWYRLYARQLGLRFQRQRVIRGWIVDFVCFPLKLVVEVDGPYHEEPEVVKRDAIREHSLRHAGFTVLRFTNDEVLCDIGCVLGKIKAAMDTILEP